MEVKIKGRQSGLATSLIGGAMLAFSINSNAAEMDHSQHQGMDHSQHAGMDHSKHAQAAQHVHHSHGAGQWMFEVRWMRMNMEDLLDGDSSVSGEDISGIVMPNNGCMMSKDPTKPYCMAPTEMTMDMKMFMMMYGFTDKISGMLMFNYLDNEMDMDMYMRMMAGGPVMSTMTGSMDTSGWGDTQAGAMYKVDDKMTAGLMLSIPTGNIDEEVDMTMCNTMTCAPTTTMRAPYAMQLGSGTYDLIPSIQYTTTSGMWTYGGQAEYTYRLGENSKNYTLGNKLKLSGWGKYAVNQTWKLTGRLDYMNQDEIDGEDTRIMKIMAPTSDPDNYGGTRLDLTLDANAGFGAHNVGIAYTVPVQQDVNGIQMELQSIITLSYMYMM